MDNAQNTDKRPARLRQWITGELNFMADVNERNSLANMVLAHFFDVDSTRLAMNEPLEFGTGDLDSIRKVIRRLRNNEPIQYILGEADFYGRKFYVDSHVLIPRQETELLVDAIVKENAGGDPVILDIGTGSGCIAVSLKMELKKAPITGLDVSEKALDCAMKNAARHGAGVNWQMANILVDELSPAVFDIVVSNPPYVCDGEKSLMQRNVLDYEPHLALFVPDRDPLIYYRAIAQKGFSALREGGKIYLEINEAFGDEMVKLLENQGFEEVEVWQDLQQKDRIVKGIKRNIKPALLSDLH